MGIAAFAKAELEAAGVFDKDSDYNGMIGEAVMELVGVFAKQGHSGGSASMVASLFAKVVTYQPLLPIQNIDAEWMEHEDGIFQNKRCSALFKEGKDGRPYYLDAVVWRTPKGITYTGVASGVRSSAYVREFPWTPKSFTIDVDEHEVAPDDWEFTIKEPLDLHPAEAMYDLIRREGR